MPKLPRSGYGRPTRDPVSPASTSLPPGASMTFFESRDVAANTPGGTRPPRPVCVPKTKPPWTGGTRCTAERREGGPMSVACTHLDQIRVTSLPDRIDGCEECLKIGSPWVHLRMCTTCGKIGCCDSSPNRHASRHALEAEPSDHALGRARRGLELVRRRRGGTSSTRPASADKVLWPGIASRNGSWSFRSFPSKTGRHTKMTLHLWVQVVGNIRLASTAPRNHWWHVPLYVDVRGLTTRRMLALERVQSFQIDFDFIDHRLVVRNERWRCRILRARGRAFRRGI